MWIIMRLMMGVWCLIGFSSALDQWKYFLDNTCAIDTKGDLRFFSGEAYIPCTPHCRPQVITVYDKLPYKDVHCHRCCFNMLNKTVDGSWSSWGNFSECKGCIGAASQFRQRVCNDPFPRNGGKLCITRDNISRYVDIDYRDCISKTPCPVSKKEQQYGKLSSNLTIAIPIIVFFFVVIIIFVVLCLRRKYNEKISIPDTQGERDEESSIGKPPFQDTNKYINGEDIPQQAADNLGYTNSLI